MKRASSCRMPVHADVSGAAPAAAFSSFQKIRAVHSDNLNHSIMQIP
ncbi:hypothetical protein OH687_33910 [Burkholderia anthina]|nr:hypothetical protein OH687_33910 [Burkholderia anthina]